MMAPAETAAAATARMVAAVGGGSVAGDDDDDDILHAETLPLSLRDPMSNSRIRRAARIVGAKSPRAFDLDYFLETAKRSRKWQCPITCAHQPGSVPCTIIHSLPARYRLTPRGCGVCLVWLNVTLNSVSEYGHAVPLRISTAPWPPWFCCGWAVSLCLGRVGACVPAACFVDSRPALCIKMALLRPCCVCDRRSCSRRCHS